METNNSKDDVVNDSTNSKDSEEDESFVTKVRSRVSGLFSSSFSRLFKNQDKQSGVVRLRPNEEDEEINQPPRKRARGLENDVLSSQYYRDNTITQAEFRISSSNESGLGNNTEPIAGPSYISQRDNLKNISATLTSTGASNKDKYVDSGYSSMGNLCNKQTHEITSDTSKSMSKPIENNVSERKSLFNITTPETPNRSLFADQSGSPQDKNTSLRSRRPSFNTSTFGSPSFVDRTLTTSKIMNSPFYNGSTVYGGASAYGRQLGMNETRKQQLQNSFMVKPINRSSESKSFTSLSKTARRILETLEQCSTPLSDVKKVPLPTRSEKPGLFSKYVAANPYQKNSKFSNKELLVPSVAERLKMKQIQRLQDTTNEIRQIATASSSSLNSEEYKIASDNQQKHTNKMKSKITSVRPKAATIEIIDNYILNPVPLMIPQNKLPKFDVAELKVPAANPDQTKESPIVEKEKPNNVKDVLIAEKARTKTEEENPATQTKNTSIVETNINEIKTVVKETESKKKDIVEYVFSKPLVIADNSKSLVAINNFKFSEPLSKKVKYSEKSCEPVQKMEKTTENKLTNGSICRDTDEIVCKKSSDPLFEKFKAPEGSWECQTCLIRNKSSINKCAACETPRVENGYNSKEPAFGFKKADEWECTTCLVRNKVHNNLCVACSTPKPPKPETNGIGNKFKAPSKGWECETCWVRNKPESVKCVACETVRKSNDLSKTPSKKCVKCLSQEIDGKCLLCEKAGSQVKSDFPSHLRPSSDSWECGTCLIRNKNDLKVCAACETPKEKLANEVGKETLNKKSEKWECPTCMVRNDSEVLKCPCCETAKPGVTLVSKSNVSMFNFGVNKTQFNFGIPKDMQSSNPLTSSTTSLFASSSSETATAPFKFGITETKDPVTTESKISFPSLPSTEPKSDVKPDSTLKSVTGEKEVSSSVNFQFKAPSAVPDKNSIPVFKFGTDSKDAKETPAANSLFKFNASKPVTGENNFKVGNDLVSPSEGLKKPEVAAVPIAAVPKSDPNPLFTFGSKDNNSKDQAAKPMFSFGGSSVKPGGGFSFNQVKSDAPQKPFAAPSFPTSSVQLPQSTNSGSTTLKNGGFNFGSTSTNSNRAAVFSFGAAQNPTEATQLPTSGFDFSTAAKPTGGFNFTSPASTFDAGGAKPTFNFTGGSVPTFSANPADGAGGPVPVRKFKKAVRRTQR